MRSRLAVFLALFLVLAASPRADDGVPLVVELFTSQGCSSCPPADAYLAELAEREGILALSYHVDYWDYIGWDDPFASYENTRRQRDYAKRFNIRYVYTPQIVIDGIRQFTGSKRAAIEAALAARTEHGPHRPLDFGRNPETGDLVVRLPTTWDCGGCDVWLVTFDDSHTTPVKRGENAGRSITNRNVVRHLERVAVWHGEAREIVIPRPEKGDTAAVLLQEHATGHIVGAATVGLR